MHLSAFFKTECWSKHNMWNISATLGIFNNKLQKYSFKNHFLWKNQNVYKRICIVVKSITPLIHLITIRPFQGSDFHQEQAFNVWFSWVGTCYCMWYQWVMSCALQRLQWCSLVYAYTNISPHAIYTPIPWWLQ